MASGFTCRQCRVLLKTLEAPSRKFGVTSKTNRWHSTIRNRPVRVVAASNNRSSSVLSPRNANNAASSMSAVPSGLQYQHSEEEQRSRLILQPNNLFHPFSTSPSPTIRRRAAFVKQHALCPHSSHRQTRVPVAPQDVEGRKTPMEVGGLAPAHVKFECPDCGIPTYCCEEHWAEDYEAHLEICDTLRQINEDDHDLRSGRNFHEFEYPGLQMDEILVNMTNWDTLLYTLSCMS